MLECQLDGHVRRLRIPDISRYNYETIIHLAYAAFSDRLRRFPH